MNGLSSVYDENGKFVRRVRLGRGQFEQLRAGYHCRVMLPRKMPELVPYDPDRPSSPYTDVGPTMTIRLVTWYLDGEKSHFTLREVIRRG